MTSGDVVFSISDYAQEFIRKYKNPKLDQKVIDAIIVDFINYYAVMYCGMDLALYTSNLRDEKKMSEDGTVLQYLDILPTLFFALEQYDKFGIMDSVNRNSHMNECGGNVEADNAEAIKLIKEFIRGYMRVRPVREETY